MLENNNMQMIEEIKDIIISSRNKIAYEVNNTMLLAYWNVGRIIVENEQNGNNELPRGRATRYLCMPYSNNFNCP